MAIASNLKYIFLSFLLLLKLIGILLIFAPLFLFRSIASILAKIFKPELYKILPRFNSVFTVRDDSGLEERNNVILTLKIGGILNYETLLSTVSKFVFEFKPGTSDLLYPEFHLYWEDWLGFPFWKWEKNFRVKNHVSQIREFPSNKINNNSENLEEEGRESEFIADFEKYLLQKPYEEETSPWEIVAIDSLNISGSTSTESCYYLFMKFHHAICDGYSIFNLLMRCSDNIDSNPNLLKQASPTPSSTFLDLGVLARAWRYLTFPFAAAYEIVRLEAAITKSNPFQLPTSKTVSAPKVIVKSNRIPLDNLRRRSAAWKTSFTATLVSAISLGTQRYLRSQAKCGTKKELPDFMLAQFPVPIPGRPNGLTNHFSMVCLKLPIGLRNSERRRLQICEKEIEHAKQSPYKEAMWIMIKLLGSLPNCLQKRMEHVGGSVEIASFPGPKQQVTFYGQPILDMYYNVVCGQYSLDLCILSYDGGMRIVANADPRVFPSEDQLSDLVREIEEEIARPEENLIVVNEDTVVQIV